MNDLSSKTIIVDSVSYYIYSQLVYNSEEYILCIKNGSDINEGINIFKLTNEKDKYYIDEDIDKKVIEKFIVFLSI